MRSRFTTVYSVRKMLVKPRLGRRRCSGIWPPSKPRIRLKPERDPWPLWPRVEVLPMPDPIPRPTRLRDVFAFFGARRFDKFFAMIFLAVTPARLDTRRLALMRLLAFQNPHQMRNGLHHTANGFCIHALNDL